MEQPKRATTSVSIPSAMAVEEPMAMISVKSCKGVSGCKVGAKELPKPASAVVGCAASASPPPMA